MQKFILIWIMIFSTTGFLYPSLHQKGRVIRVVDGDTFHVRLDTGKKVKVRLLGVDTPESYKTRFGYREYLGKTVSRFVRRLLQGQRVELEFQASRRRRYGRGRYGRALAYVNIAGRDLGDLLLRKGYASVYRKKRCSRHSRYIRLEARAKRIRAGIWNARRARQYYRTLYRNTNNDKLIIWFWKNDKAFLRMLLRN